MKKFVLIPVVISLFLLMMLISGCDTIKQDDPCDETVKPEIEVGIKAVVHVLDKNKNPIPNQQLNLWLYKKPCGAEVKGNMEFSGLTDAQGTRSTATAYFKLRNLEDEVWVDAYAVQLGNGSAQKDSEYVIYKYSDFIPGTPKEVHVYIYRNF